MSAPSSILCEQARFVEKLCSLVRERTDGAHGKTVLRARCRALLGTVALQALEIRGMQSRNCWRRWASRAAPISTTVGKFASNLARGLLILY
jgi:hypothetical protein